MEFFLGLILGLVTPEWGHTWIEPTDKLIYATRSLSPESGLCVFDTEGNLLGEASTKGRSSCHVTVLGKQAVVSDYSSGTLSLYELDRNGIPEGNARTVNFPARPIPEGNTAIDRKRQKTAHIHSSWLSPDGKTLVVVDLGSDRLYLYPVRRGRIVEKKKDVVLPDGCGPRHCCFGKGVIYVATELSDEVLVLSWPECRLKQSLLVNDVKPRGGSHLALSPDGRYLYVSSRLKNDGIGIFSVRPDGLLEKTGFQPTGVHPRHFSITDDGLQLLVACRDSDCVEIFDRKEDGSLVKSGEIKVGKPVFVKKRQ